MRNFDGFKNEAFRKNPALKKAYDELEPEYVLIEAIIRKRLEKGLSQKELAERLGTKQSAIARLESGRYNPSFHFLAKVAKALDGKLHISL